MLHSIGKLQVRLSYKGTKFHNITRTNVSVKIGYNFEVDFLANRQINFDYFFLNLVTI